MEMLILLFLLVSLDKNPALRESLCNFLGFYKENRELFASVMQQSAPAPAAGQPSPAAEQPPRAAERQESRPDKVDSLDILEKYLKRYSV